MNVKVGAYYMQEKNIGITEPKQGIFWQKAVRIAIKI